MVEIDVVNLHLIYPIYGSSSRSLKTNLLNIATGGKFKKVKDRETINVEALRAVTFHLQSGDRLALVGHNGSGKSTLLKVLAGIYPPTEGFVSIRGRVSSSLNISLTFEEDASGYDNIRLAGLWMGLSKQNIQRLIEDTVSFTDLGNFLAMPIRTYSAGMKTRLAFAVSTAIVPDILLLDEGLGAGDASFWEKAQDRTNRYLGSVKILVLASHSTELLKKFCNKALWLEHGEVKAFGELEPILEAYHCPQRVISNSLSNSAPESSLTSYTNSKK
jgi:ABC-type polysaccharide/polyol phosphate transport system ATPase subunit